VKGRRHNLIQNTGTIIGLSGENEENHKKLRKVHL
jgi:hypothetical protein